MEKATEACKRKGRKYCSCVGTLERCVALKWKEDKIAFWSAEEFWKLNETLCVRSVDPVSGAQSFILNVQEQRAIAAHLLISSAKLLINLSNKRCSVLTSGIRADGLVVDDVIGDVIQSQKSAGSLQSSRKKRRSRRSEEIQPVARFSRKIQQKRKRSSSRLESAGAKQLTTYEELRRAGCQLLSEIQNGESDKSLQRKGRKYFYFTEERCTKIERRQDSLLER
ncbi:hypothetical protein F511_29172 [Dorcoceras hygrometricum]|uniref:Uncharacterized protein n=1 Tax=Dorcoceras hygrometricum TaxID=472368 RepID=A0A2Z7BVB8_9LAMI|nr:hypothetical protein F511_29172 [Dorcoceras hygrometricum]